MSCALFEAALELDARDRVPFLERACGGDAATLRLVQRMLEADGSTPNAVDRLNAALGPIRSSGFHARPPGGGIPSGTD